MMHSAIKMLRFLIPNSSRPYMTSMKVSTRAAAPAPAWYKYGRLYTLFDWASQAPCSPAGSYMSLHEARVIGLVPKGTQRTCSIPREHVLKFHVPKWRVILSSHGTCLHFAALCTAYNASYNPKSHDSGTGKLASKQCVPLCHH